MSDTESHRKREKIRDEALAALAEMAETSSEVLADVESVGAQGGVREMCKQIGAYAGADADSHAARVNMTADMTVIGLHGQADKGHVTFLTTQQGDRCRPMGVTALSDGDIPTAGVNVIAVGAVTELHPQLNTSTSTHQTAQYRILHDERDEQTGRADVTPWQIVLPTAAPIQSVCHPHAPVQGSDTVNRKSVTEMEMETVAMKLEGMTIGAAEGDAPNHPCPNEAPTVPPSSSPEQGVNTQGMVGESGSIAEWMTPQGEDTHIPPCTSHTSHLRQMLNSQQKGVDEASKPHGGQADDAALVVSIVYNVLAE
jgi:hypothetical protein